MKQFYFIFLFLVFSFESYSQVGIGTNSPNASAMLDIQSANKGLLIPRLTTAQRKAIVNPAPGLLLYDLDMATLYFFDGQNWLALARAAEWDVGPALRSATGGSSKDGFGSAVAISGDYAVVGAPRDDVGSNADQGSAYVFVRTNGTWVQQAKISASDGAAGDLFGTSVSISGDVLVVGAPADDAGLSLNSGSVYIFSRNGTSWVQQARLTASDAAAGDEFGGSVSIDGDYLLVGASLDNINANTDQGSAYVFFNNRTQWVQQAKLTATSVANASMGESVSIHNNIAVVGAPRHTAAGITSGAAFVYVRSGTTWTLEATLLESNPANGNRFGQSVAVSGSNILVGAPGKRVFDVPDEGMAFVYTRILFGSVNVWTQQSGLYLPGTSYPDILFGARVALSGNYALVCSERLTEDNYAAGMAFLFQRSGSDWNFVKRVRVELPSPQTFINGFSIVTGNIISVAISENHHLVGWPNFDKKDNGKIAFGTNN